MSSRVRSSASTLPVTFLRRARSLSSRGCGSSSIEPFPIGEQDGHLLALAFKRGAGGEDLVGEMFGSVGAGLGPFDAAQDRCRVSGTDT